MSSSRNNVGNRDDNTNKAAARYYTSGTRCSTYSLHSQITNKNPSKRWIDRRILGVSYMCGMDLHNGILCCGFLCARIISLYFSTLFLPMPCVFSVFLLRLPRQGLSRPIYIARAITPSPLHGYHACVFTSRLSRHSSEFHFRVITPELSRSTTHVNRVITPALVSSS